MARKSYAAPQHAGDGGRRRRRRHKDDEPHRLSNDKIPAYKQHIGKQASPHLQYKKHDMQSVQTHGAQRHAAEGEQQHEHEQKRRKRGKAGEEGVSRGADDDGHHQRPLLEKKKNSLHDISRKQPRRNTRPAKASSTAPNIAAMHGQGNRERGKEKTFFPCRNIL